MIHDVRLVFGYNGYYGDITVSPQAMLIFLQKPFGDWLYVHSWKDIDVPGWNFEDFHYHICNDTAHLNDEYFYFDPKGAEWMGFRVTLDQDDADAEFVFTIGRITGEIRPDLDRLAVGITKKLLCAKGYINRALESVKRRGHSDNNQGGDD